MGYPGYTLFDTPIGRCAIVWNECGILCVQLPEASVHDTRMRIESRYRGASETKSPSDVRRAINGIVTVLHGGSDALDDLELDMRHLPDFHRRVYRETRKIPKGKTATYGNIADRVGAPGGARAVGQALGRNPFAIVVPCHRVLAASGKLCGFSARGGLATKQRLLTIEGALSPAATETQQYELFGSKVWAP